MKKLLAVMATALVLSACGGSDGDSGGVTPTPTPTPTPPMAMIDAFYTAVSSFIAQMSETAEPLPIESITTTSPESTEPQPLS